jgi:Gpi18-like mannosyltransferase
MSPPDQRPLPIWARALDALGLALLLIGFSVVVTGGFREFTPFGRISVTTWTRPVILGLLLLAVRHWRWRRPSIVHRALAAFGRLRRSEAARVVWPIFLSTRLGVLVVGFFGIALIGYAPNTPPWRVYGNDFLNLPARWDTGWYLGVAIDGYSFEHTREISQQNIAFFPLYPMLLRYISPFLAHQYLWVGLGLSLIAFLWALVYLYRLAREQLDEEAAAAATVFLATYPFALFYSAAYTESIFLLTMVAACYHFQRDELWKSAAWGLAAGLVRPNGCLLSVVLGLMALRDARSKPLAAIADRLATAAAPGIGMLIYSTYIFFLTGNPLQWTQQNAAWGRVYRGVDSLVSDRYAYIQNNGFYNYASTLGLDMITAVAVLFVLAAVWPVYRRFGVPYAAMILINVLLPLSLGGLLSMGRVTAVLFPVFLWLGAAVPARQRTGWIVGFAMMQALCAVAFFTWRPLY